ncbi:MAG TPA: STAS domain-containing protein [Solirubrobacteraceae bacterium]|nr:STAS domain-containing protein [Solirubrobacteraceae bacterium]
MQGDFGVETHTSGRLTTLTVTGELDLVSSPVLEREIERANGLDTDLILLDLRGLEFMDSTGLHLLVKAHQSAEQAGHRLALTKGSEQVQRLLDLTGVGELVRIVESPEELLDSDHGP